MPSHPQKTYQKAEILRAICFRKWTNCLFGDNSHPKMPWKALRIHPSLGAWREFRSSRRCWKHNHLCGVFNQNHRIRVNQEAIVCMNWLKPSHHVDLNFSHFNHWSSYWISRLFSDSFGKAFYTPKTNMTMEKQTFEDIQYNILLEKLWFGIAMLVFAGGSRKKTCLKTRRTWSERNSFFTQIELLKRPTIG